MSCHQVGKNSYDDAIKERSHAYDLIRREVAQGRQAYIVLPWLKNQKSWMFVQLLRNQRLQESSVSGGATSRSHGIS